MERQHISLEIALHWPRILQEDQYGGGCRCVQGDLAPKEVLPLYEADTEDITVHELG